MCTGPQGREGDLTAQGGVVAREVGRAEGLGQRECPVGLQLRAPPAAASARARVPAHAAAGIVGSAVGGRGGVCLGMRVREVGGGRRKSCNRWDGTLHMGVGRGGTRNGWTSTLMMIYKVIGGLASLKLFVHHLLV